MSLLKSCFQAISKVAQVRDRHALAGQAVILLRHRPGLQVITLLGQLGAHFLDQAGPLCRVGIDTRRHLLAPDTGAGPVDHGQAQLTSTVGCIPGYALERFEGVVGNQQGFVDTERGIHGSVSLWSQTA